MSAQKIKLEDLKGETDYQKVINGYNSYIVKPINAFGLGGFLFDVEGETVQTTKSEITDHFVEDNSAVQDHVANRPLTIELNGFVGELADIQSEDFVENSQKAIQKLTTIEGYLPALAVSANVIIDAIEAGTLPSLEDTIDETSNLYALIKNANPTATRQQQAYLYFKTVQQQRVLLSIETPFEFLQNMAVETIVATQEEGTNQVSNFTITMKQIRTTSVELVAFNKLDSQGKNAAQKQSVENKGKAQGTDKSLAVEIYEGIFGQ